ncbi:hypothetical protein NPE20_25890 [Mucilaginibacter sp. JC4]|uniref:Uncharacterized protein n=1 Tax=Mucilaginibacter aquariorum TaxID=2967225 RepID=A0ABT1TAI5_9SPHI|nr:hypothetical protein [Mucilaginibacter aquariorum]
MRKYTIFHLEIRKLNLEEIISLAIFFAIDIGRLCLNIFSQPEKYKFFYDFGLAFLMMFVVVSSFAAYFTSFYFSITWFLLSVLYIVEGDRALSYLCLLLFLLFHCVRLLFIRRYKIEFVPPEPLKGRFRSVYSELEGRSSDKRDNTYMSIIIWGATFIFLSCLMLSGKKV